MPISGAPNRPITESNGIRGGVSLAAKAGFKSMEKDGLSEAIWVAEGPRVCDQIASNWYMSIIPAQEVGGRVVAFSKETESPDSFLDRYDPRVVILNKAFNHDLVDLALEAKKRGVKVISILCDWHFDKPQNQALNEIADIIVVQTSEMAKAVQDHYRRDVVIIEEAYEGPRQPPQFAPDKPVKVVWYGHAANLDTLGQGLEQLTAIDHTPVRLALVTNASADQVAAIVSGVHRNQSDIRLKLVRWSREAQWQYTHWADLVLLPSKLDRSKTVKGHNRLVQAIHSGRLALAYPLPR